MCNKTKATKDCEKRLVITVNHEGREIILFTEWFVDSDIYDRDEETGLTADELEKVHALLEASGLTVKDIVYCHRSLKKDNINAVYVSEHAYKRLKERNNWNKKTATRMAVKIYNDGKRIQEVDAVTRAYIVNKTLNKTNCKIKKEFVVYGDIIYVFNNRTLITCYHLPSKTTIRNTIFKMSNRRADYES